MPTEAWPVRPGLKRLLRFGITGVLATAVHVAVAVALITQLGVRPYVANPTAFLVATGFSYTINTLWSFSSRMSHRTMWRYAAVSGFGCLASAAISAAAEAMHLDYRIGILMVIVIVTPMNFVLHSSWTYRGTR